jgi:phosphatidylserine decarboxylase
MSLLSARQIARAPLRLRNPHLPLRPVPARPFSSSQPVFGQRQRESFRSRLNSALKDTKIEWKPIPVALGVAFIGAWQVYRIQRREKHTQSNGTESGEPVPKKRERIRPTGPWFVALYLR